MLRFVVTRQYVKYKGKMYKKGELLPPEFTERDRCRNIYPSRIGTTVIVDSSAPTEEVSQGTTSAAKPLSSNTPITGTKPVSKGTASTVNNVKRVNTSK